MSPSPSVARCTKRLHRVLIGDVERIATASPPPARIWSTSSWHFSTRRAPSATGKPRDASSSAVAAPIPDDAPATSAGRRAGFRNGASGLLHCDRQVRESAHAAGMDTDGVGLVDLETADP
jgi:hypothetical protein